MCPPLLFAVGAFKRPEPEVTLPCFTFIVIIPPLELRSTAATAATASTEVSSHPALLLPAWLECRQTQHLLGLQRLISPAHKPMVIQRRSDPEAT
jgi:hypothetical protein